MSIKILVADDSITIQKVIGIIFGSSEYTLTIVDNGKAAVDMARDINPDILLIDALMPGMSGYEVAEAVRSTPSLAAKPILILTGSFEPFDEDKAKKCGADDFIAKPFESQQIINKVKELLEVGRNRGSSTLNSAFKPAAELPKAVPVSETVTLSPLTSAPITAHPPEIKQTAAVSDIWGAFTPEATLPPVMPVQADASEPFVAPSETDVFAIVTEEHDAQIVQTVVPENNAPQQSGSPWVPVEENTFEFEEETVAYPTPADAEKAVEVPDFTVTEPEFTAATLPTSPFVPLADPLPAVTETAAIPALSTLTHAEAPVALTEDQIKAAISSLSKDVIERIVWEVVPDLAEAMIREAIRKIKEGV
jgi:CheY-like chemotaxis protein